MLWIKLTAILLVELLVVLLIVQAIVQLDRRVLRWLSWLTLLAGVTMTLKIVAEQFLESAVPDGAWESGGHWFSLRAPYPTFRILVGSLFLAFPAMLLLVGLGSLLRRSDQGLVIVRWPVSMRTTVRALGIAGLLLLATFVLSEVVVRSKLRALQGDMAALATEITPPDCAPEDNAYSLYTELAPLIQENDPDLELLLLGKISTSDDDRDDYLRRNASVAAQIRDAAQRSHYRAEIDWSQIDVLADYPDLDAFRECQKLLENEGQWALRHGNIDLGLANALALRRMAEQLTHDPRMMARMYAWVAERAATELIEHWLHLQQPTDTLVAALIRDDFDHCASLPAYIAWEEGETYDMLAKQYLGLADESAPPFALAIVAAVRFKDRFLYAGDDIQALPRFYRDMKQLAADWHGKKSNDSLRTMPDLDRFGGGEVASYYNRTYAMWRGHIDAEMQRRIADFAIRLAARQPLPEVREAEFDPHYCPANELPEHDKF
jgi:hypothetical protein